MAKTIRKQDRVESRTSGVTSQIRNVAKNLMIYEAPDIESPESSPRVEFNFNERLRSHIARLYGVAGYRSLLSRALVRADSEVPWLRAMHIKSDGSLDVLDIVQAHLDPDEILEGKIALLSHLLGSLVAYIGPSLALRLMSEVWPKTPLNKLAPSG